MKKQLHFKIISIISFAIILAFTFTACGEDSDELVGFVWIPPGTFTMGSPTGEPDRNNTAGIETQHSVTISKGFYMSKYQITQGQYFALMELIPSYHPSGDGKGRLPVEGVSWYDAIVFCNKLSIKYGFQPVYSISGSTNPDEWGTVPTSSDPTWNAVKMIGDNFPNDVPNGYRLPTEAEWEYACRAGTETAYNTGPSIDSTQANYDKNIGNTTEVGSYAPNAWGLYDMHGNVSEWCWDWYGVYYSSSPPSDPTGPVSGSYRMIRGGSWFREGRILRSACRSVSNPFTRGDVIGFRLVRP